jgi:HK97 family phage prohead protease
MSKVLEFRTFSLEIKEATASATNLDEGHFEGYASTFGNVDQGLDIVDQGAFKVTLKNNKGKFPILADHNWSDHIGYNEAAHEDKSGLFVQGAINLKVQKGVEKFALAKQALKVGVPMGLSIGYSTIQATQDQSNINIRHLTELKLWEYSFVTFPMNVEAMVTTAKSLGAIDKAKFLIQQLKEQGISVSDLEMALRIEAAANDEDPTAICQSLDNLIAKFRNS